MHNPGIVQQKPFPLLQQKLLPLQIRPKARFFLSLCFPSRSALQNLCALPSHTGSGPSAGTGDCEAEEVRGEGRPSWMLCPAEGKRRSLSHPPCRTQSRSLGAHAPHILGSCTPSTGSASAELVPPQTARQAHEWHLTPVCSLPGGLRSLGRGPGNSRGPASSKW